MTEVKWTAKSRMAYRWLQANAGSNHRKEELEDLTPTQCNKLMQDLGMTWDVEQTQWRKSKHAPTRERRSPPAEGKVSLCSFRVTAERGAITALIRDFRDVLELANVEVTSISGEFPDNDGVFVRVYIRGRVK